MRKFLLIVICSFPLATLAGGGWTQPRGKGFFKIGQSAIVGTNYFRPNGSVVAISPAISIFSTSFYGEYGITDNLTGILYCPFFVRAIQNEQVRQDGSLLTEGDALNSMGDTDVSLKYGLIRQRPVFLSVSLTLGLPFGEDSGGNSGILQTGDGEFNQMISADAGTGFANGIYMNAMAGFNHRTNDFSDEFRYGYEVGWSKGRFVGLLRLSGIKPLGRADDDFKAPNGIFNNRTEYLAFTPEILFRFTEKLGIAASVGGAFYGKNVLANPNFTGGIFLKL